MNRTLLALIIAGLFICTSHYLQAQGRTISGRVVSSEDDSGLPGVNVVIEGTPVGTTTDSNGDYTITAPEQSTITFSFIGFVTQKIPVDNRATINVQLRPDVTQLTEVVVTGYNTTEKKDIIGSIVSVTTEDFKDIPVVSLDQALQGQASGVQVTQSSGTPGGGIMVRIRGNTSISASNRPLFVVDGVPVIAGALGQGEYGGQTDNALALFNPNDIESIQILKDASSKAIYGSRAANGVVLITTKRGKNNSRTVINADIQRGVIDPTKKLKLLNSSQLLELQREAVRNAGKDPDQLGLIPGVTDAVNTNWLDEVFRQGIYQQYQLSANGGNESTRFYLSGSYRDEEGVQLNNQFTRYTGTLNVDHKATSKLSFGTNLTLSRAKNNRVYGDNNVDGVYTGAIRSLPYHAPYDEQGKIIVPGDPNYAGFPNLNPVGQALLPRYETYTVKILGGIYGEYSLLKNLKFRSKLSVDYTNIIQDQYDPPTVFYGYFVADGGQGYGEYGTRAVSILVNTNLLTYTNTIREKHNFNVLLGNEILRGTSRTSVVIGNQFPADFTYISSAGLVNSGSSFLSNNGLLSFFGEFKYDFDDRYLASFTTRADGSSRFGANRRFGFFPSVSAGWRISAEPFMQNLELVEDLKLRVSAGYTGNERIGEFQYLATWGSREYNGLVGTGPSGLGNPDLQWERTREFNLGLDVSLFNGRVGITTDVYSNLTDKLLFTQPIPSTTGFGGIQGNIGDISNKGVELTVNTVNTDGPLKWTTNFNISKNINKIVSLASDEPIFAGFEGNASGATHVVLPGNPLGTFWGMKFLGVDPATGDALYADKNGDGTITGDDAMVIGNAQPDFIGGFTNRLQWKGFEVSAFLQFSYGNQIVNNSNAALLNAGETININQVEEALKRWQKPGDITHIPRYEEGNTYNNYFSSRFVEDGSYLRLKNLTIGYNLKNNWISRFRVSNARIYASGTNLWTLTPYSGADPEVSTFDGSTTAQGTDQFTLPQVRTVMLGLSIGF